MLRKLVLVAFAVALLPRAATATPLFFDDFASGLTGYTPQGIGPINGAVVVDPLNPANKVLTFTGLNSGGDMYTTASFLDPSESYVLSFDYLGLAKPGSDAGNFGGFIGVSHGFPGQHYWLAGTIDSYAGIFVALIDDGAWHHYDIAFTLPITLPYAMGTGPIHVMIEDFSGSGGVSGDAYFDDVALSGPVPEPSTLFLMGAGLGLLAVRRLRRG